MAATGLSQLHVLPLKEKCKSQILPGEHPRSLSSWRCYSYRTSDTSPVTDRRFHENTLDFIFQQDGASGHTQLWDSRVAPIQFFHSYETKTNFFLILLTSQPWKILGHHQGKGEYVKPSQELQQTVETCWKRIDTETLHKLIK
jgi:hypothetical protein